VFVGFSGIFLLGISNFKGLTARRLYKMLGVKGLMARKNYVRNFCFPQHRDKRASFVLREMFFCCPAVSPCTEHRFHNRRVIEDKINFQENGALCQ
jgi:hypothetical protein